LDTKPRSSRIHKFGVFELDLEAGELRKSGVRQKLVGQPFQVLQLLLEHPQQVVTREELKRHIWPQETYVDYDLALRRVINKLREVLGDSADSPRFIETIPRHGYRFIAPVSGNGNVVASPDLPLPTQTVSRRGLQIGIVLGLGAVVVFVAVLGFMPSDSRQRLFGKATTPQIQSVAVLPLQNLSADSAQEYFSDGITDALITELAQIGSIKVISRTSVMHYKKTDKTLPEIARELKVDGIVEGTVQRSGDRVRITAQLIQAPSDKHLWANSYERDVRDVFMLERDVAGDIASHVQASLTTWNQRLPVQLRPLNPKALEAYLQGKYHLSRYNEGSGDEEKRKAGKYFQEAINDEPDFAPAYVELANAHLSLFLLSKQDTEIATKAAERAIALSPGLSDAHKTLGDIKFRAWDWAGAEVEYRRATALNPNSPDAHDALGDVLDATGRVDEGWREEQIAQELDPNRDHLSDALLARGQYDQALALVKMMLKRYPDDGYLHYRLFRGYVLKGMYKEAVLQLDPMWTLLGFPQVAADVRRADAASGFRGAIGETIKVAEHLAATNQVFLPVPIVECYMILGNKDRAFYWLEQAYKYRDKTGEAGLEYIRYDRILDPLRSDPRFKDLLHRMGLPQ